jgi:hypothetical protein
MSNPFSDKYAVPSAQLTETIEWSNHGLLYLLSILKPEEVAADALIFNPPLEVLEDLTYPFHLQIWKKAPRMLVAKSNRGCFSAELARRSLVHSLLSDYELIIPTIARYNALWAIHSTKVATLESMLRAMCKMMTVSDDEWVERFNQLCGMCHGDYTGQGVDENCSVETRLEYYFLRTGKVALEDWIRCVSACLGMCSDERAAHTEVYDEAGSFLVKAYKEMIG